MKICKAEGCEKPSRAKGLCGAHYKRWRKWGDLRDHRPGRSTCVIEGCDSVVKGNGYCNRHYGRWRLYGDPEAPSRQKVAAPCIYEGCEEKSRTHGYCRRHFDRFRFGHPMNGREVIRVCRMSNCWNKHHTKGLCQKHYRRWVKWDDPFFDGRHYWECVIEGCTRKGNGGEGLCYLHRNRQKKWGDPIAMPSDRVVAWGERLSAEPLVEYVNERGGIYEVVSERGIGWKSLTFERITHAWERAVKRGYVDLAVADDFACNLLRVHPFLIWGEDYWDKDAMESELEAA